MIFVTVDLLEDSSLKEVVVEGHAGFSLHGTDIVCAGVTVLVRTFWHLVGAGPGVSSKTTGLVEGRFSWSLRSIEPAIELRYEAWSWFFLRGLEDLCQEFPDSIKMEYRRHSGRLSHGS